MTSSNAPTVIIGAGFAGLFTALHLTNQNYPHPIILIDRNERFCFKPLLYDYLSGEMQPYQINPVYVELLQGREITFIKDTVTSIDLEARQVHLEDGSIKHYGNLVVTPGSVPSFFAKGAAENAFTFQSQADATQLKQHLMKLCLEAAQQRSPEARRALLTVAIVGGGPVGVELALTLGDLLPQWYETVSRTILSEAASYMNDIRVLLINRGPILKGDVNSLLRDTAMAAMEERTVQPELILGASVKVIHPNIVEFIRDNQSERLLASTVIWTAGTQVHPLIKAMPVPDSHRTPYGHLLVEPTLQLLGYPEVFAAGDCAVVKSDSPQNEPLPATAQVAYQQGEAIAKSLLAKAKQADNLPASTVSLRGTIMKLGKGTAVANVFDRYEITGIVGQTIRQMMYLSLMPAPNHNARTTLSWIKDDVFKAHAGVYHDVDYTAGYEVEELLTLAEAVVLSATAVSKAEVGLIPDQIEFIELKKALASATTQYPESPLLHALFGHSVKRKLVLERAYKESVPLEQLLEEAVASSRHAISILKLKATAEELNAYREFAYNCCVHVAQAARNTPLDKHRISSKEEAILKKLKAAFDINHG